MNQELALRIGNYNKVILVEYKAIIRDIKAVYELTNINLDMKMPSIIISYQDGIISISRDGHTEKYQVDDNNLELAHILGYYKKDIDYALNSILQDYIHMHGVG